ncbi:MAG: hypothetical protein GF317_09760 [Candidatus Lokiarchaeota archaeon]|nr:hypothetical protein [Candidatus Lokiarchaeota archaeon]
MIKTKNIEIYNTINDIPLQVFDISQTEGNIIIKSLTDKQKYIYNMVSRVFLEQNIPLLLENTIIYPKQQDIVDYIKEKTKTETDFNEKKVRNLVDNHSKKLATYKLFVLKMDRLTLEILSGEDIEYSLKSVVDYAKEKRKEIFGNRSSNIIENDLRAKLVKELAGVLNPEKPPLLIEYINNSIEEIPIIKKSGNLELQTLSLLNKEDLPHGIMFRKPNLLTKTIKLQIDHSFIFQDSFNIFIEIKKFWKIIIPKILSNWNNKDKLQFVMSFFQINIKGGLNNILTFIEKNLCLFDKYPELQDIKKYFNYINEYKNNNYNFIDKSISIRDYNLQYYYYALNYINKFYSFIISDNIVELQVASNYIKKLKELSNSDLSELSPIIKICETHLKLQKEFLKKDKKISTYNIDKITNILNISNDNYISQISSLYKIKRRIYDFIRMEDEIENEKTTNLFTKVFVAIDNLSELLILLKTNKIIQKKVREYFILLAESKINYYSAIKKIHIYNTKKNKGNFSTILEDKGNVVRKLFKQISTTIISSYFKTKLLQQYSIDHNFQTPNFTQLTNYELYLEGIYHIANLIDIEISSKINQKYNKENSQINEYLQRINNKNDIFTLFIIDFLSNIIQNHLLIDKTKKSSQ